jgi:hypothetical protein
MDSSGYQSLWTTITSTIAAIASAAAAILTWRQHRRGQRANDPVVELDAHWSSGKTFTGSDGMIMLQFRLRNYSINDWQDDLAKRARNSNKILFGGGAITMGYRRPWREEHTHWRPFVSTAVRFTSRKLVRRRIKD